MTHCPLVIASPAWNLHACCVHELTSSLDVAATVLALAGVATPNEVEESSTQAFACGRSLSGLLQASGNGGGRQRNLAAEAALIPSSPTIAGVHTVGWPSYFVTTDHPTLGPHPWASRARSKPTLQWLQQLRLCALEFDPIAECPTGIEAVTVAVRVAGCAQLGTLHLERTFDAITAAGVVFGRSATVRGAILGRAAPSDTQTVAQLPDRGSDGAGALAGEEATALAPHVVATATQLLDACHGVWWSADASQRWLVVPPPSPGSVLFNNPANAAYGLGSGTALAAAVGAVHVLNMVTMGDGAT